MRWSIFILLFPIFCKAQTHSNLVIQQSYPSQSFSTGQYNSDYTAVAGHPFVSDTFNTGKILLNSGEVLVQMKMKFDLSSQQLLILTPDSVLLPDMYYINAFEIDSSHSSGAEYYKKIVFKKTIAYYQVVEKGRAFLYVRKDKSIKKSNISEFKYSESFYLSVNNGKLQKLRNSKKGVINAFPDNHYMMELFINAHKINISSVNDLRRLVAYFNRLK